MILENIMIEEVGMVIYLKILVPWENGEKDDFLVLWYYYYYTYLLESLDTTLQVSKIHRLEEIIYCSDFLIIKYFKIILHFYCLLLIFLENEDSEDHYD